MIDEVRKQVRQMLEQTTGPAAEAAGLTLDAYLEQMKSYGVDLEEQMAAQIEMISASTGMSAEDYIQSQMNVMDPTAAQNAAAGWLSEDEDVLSLEDMKKILSKYDDISGKTISAAHAEDYVPSFEILLSGIISTMNDHVWDSLAAETDPENIDSVESILSSGWGIDNGDDAKEMIESLLEGRHTALYAACCNAKSEDEACKMSEDEYDTERFVNYYAFAQAFKTNESPEKLLGWDIGRAANVVRWAVAVSYITEDEGWKYMDKIANAAINYFDSFAAYGRSYLFGGLFWSYGNDGESGAGDYYEGVVEALDGLLGNDGLWNKNPWIR